MTHNMIWFNECDSAIDYVARRATIGPERYLVDSFLEKGIEGIGYSFRAKHMAVFVEPRIDSGFPDIVIAVYRPEYFSHWTKAREELSCTELKLLSYLYSVKGANSDQIRELLSLQPSSILHSTELLSDAGLIVRDTERRIWSPRPIKETFGLEHLVAIEAKVCNSQNVLDQAALNCRFASESYALTSVNPSNGFSHRAKLAGIGVVSASKRQTFRRFVKPRSFPLPSCYVSWQFNEWIGKRMVRKGLR